MRWLLKILPADDVNDFNNVYVYNLIGNRFEKQVEGGTTTKYLIDPFNHTGFAQTLKTDDGTNKVFYTIGHDVLAHATNIEAPQVLSV